MVLQVDTIIGNEPRKHTHRGARHQLPGQARFAGTRWPADQDCFPPDKHRRGMDTRCLGHRRRLGRWQPHHEPRAEDARFFCAPSDGNSVFDPNGSAMSFDDLFGNRQTKTRILPEALFWPIGIKALKNLVERFGSDARSVIVDQNLDLAFETAARNTDVPAWRRERASIVDQIADDLTETRVVAGYFEIVQRTALERQRHGYIVRT